MSRSSNARKKAHAEQASIADWIRLEDGDLILSSPTGRIVLEAGTALHVRSAGEITVDAESIALSAKQCRADVGEATLFVDSIRRTVNQVVDHIGHLEMRARRVTRDVHDFVDRVRSRHTAIDRLRIVASDAIDLLSRRTTIVSEEDTTIDGKRVLLG
jgi:hypothetical protein